jgi:hypothetical protein
MNYSTWDTVIDLDKVEAVPAVGTTVNVKYLRKGILCGRRVFTIVGYSDKYKRVYGTMGHYRCEDKDVITFYVDDKRKE